MHTQWVYKNIQKLENVLLPALLLSGWKIMHTRYVGDCVDTAVTVYCMSKTAVVSII